MFTNSINRRSVLTAALVFIVGLLGLQPASAQTYCPTYRRDCLVYIADLTSVNQSNAQKALYQALEFGAHGTAVTILTPYYRKVHVVKGWLATRAQLSSRLNSITADGNVWAVDLVFVGHGLTNEVVFSDQQVSMATVRNDILNKVPYIQRLKLRSVFDTSCYSSSHRSYWLGAGFKMASGSVAIYADSAASYPAFLQAWVSGMTFSQSVSVANYADPGRVLDQGAALLLKSWGYSKWWDVNSFRYVSGQGGLRIWHRPY
jgi:hypothetical protein